MRHASPTMKMTMGHLRYVGNGMTRRLACLCAVFSLSCNAAITFRGCLARKQSTATFVSLPHPKRQSTDQLDASETDDTNSPSPSRSKARPRIPVLEYRDDWVCIHKPAGISVHPGRQRSAQQSFVTSLLKRQLRRKVFPVHRLDHRTSGALVLAFTSEKCAQLQAALTSTTSQKRYLAVVRGDMRHFMERLLHDSELEQHPFVKVVYNGHQDDRQPAVVVVNKPLSIDGVLKESETTFTFVASASVPDHFSNETTTRSLSLVVAQPTTGRTHQIRRHAHAMTMPLLGDTQHGCTHTNRWWRQNYQMNRLALHCAELRFSANIIGEGDNERGDKSKSSDWIELVAPIPPELRSFLQSINDGQLWDEAIQREPKLLQTEWIDKRGGTLGLEKEWQKQRRLEQEQADGK